MLFEVLLVVVQNTWCPSPNKFSLTHLLHGIKNNGIIKSVEIMLACPEFLLNLAAARCPHFDNVGKNTLDDIKTFSSQIDGMLLRSIGELHIFTQNW